MVAAIRKEANAAYNISRYLYGEIKKPFPVAWRNGERHVYFPVSMAYVSFTSSVNSISFTVK